MLRTNILIKTPFKDDIRLLADLKQQISQKDDITSQHSDIVAMCCNVISSFCDICCFRFASWQMSSLRGVVNCFFAIIHTKSDMLFSLKNQPQLRGHNYTLNKPRCCSQTRQGFST